MKKTFFFDPSCCAGPDRCQAGCSSKLEGTAKNLGFYASRTAYQKTALQDSRSLQHPLSGAESSCRDLCLRVEAGLGKVRRQTRSGDLSSRCQHFHADDCGSALVC